MNIYSVIKEETYPYNSAVIQPGYRIMLHYHGDNGYTEFLPATVRMVTDDYIVTLLDGFLPDIRLPYWEINDEGFHRLVIEEYLFDFVQDKFVESPINILLPSLFNFIEKDIQSSNKQKGIIDPLNEYIIYEHYPFIVSDDKSKLIPYYLREYEFKDIYGSTVGPWCINALGNIERVSGLTKFAIRPVIVLPK